MTAQEKAELILRYGEPQADESIDAWQNPEGYYGNERFANG